MADDVSALGERLSAERRRWPAGLAAQVPGIAGPALGAGRTRVPNVVLRRIRVDERQETRAEFAESMARKAEELGERVFPSERYVARLEDGDIRYPHPAYRRVLSALCGRPATELGFQRPGMRAARGGEDSPAGAGIDCKPDPQVELTGHVFGAPEFAEIEDVKRRELLRIMGMVAPAALVPKPSRVGEALQAAMSDSAAGLEGAALDAASDALSGLVAHYSHVISVTPSAAVYDDLLSVRTFANSLLGRAGTARQRSDLIVAAGWLSSLLAIAATDMGEHAAALVWCSDTERRGRDAGHPELLGWAALTRSLIAYYHGHASRSAVLACHGQEVTGLGSAACVKLTAQEMRARAMLGDVDGMTRAKRHAVVAMERLSAESPTAGAFSIPRAEDPPYTATSLLLVKKYRESAEITRRIIETVYRPRLGSPGNQPTKYARTLLILGLAEAGLGRVEEASSAGITALECARLVWPTMVLAGKLDQVLAESSPQAAPAAEYRARYLEASENVAEPLAISGRGGGGE